MQRNVARAPQFRRRYLASPGQRNRTNSRIGTIEKIDPPSGETAGQRTRHLVRRSIDERTARDEKPSVLLLMIQLHGDDLERGHRELDASIWKIRPRSDVDRLA